MMGTYATTQFRRRWNLVVVAWLVWVHVSLAAGLTPDGLALMEFKNALIVKSPLLESWGASDASPCSWGGVNCTNSGRVRNITLVRQEPMLEGNISPSLGKLQFLEHLVLDYNRLTGTIPPELGNLTSLKVLSVAFNNLTGEIPPELGNCGILEEFVVWNNSLSGTMPHAMSKNLKLTVFDVSYNNFSGEIPSWLGNLTSLTFLDMRYNSFTGVIPTSLMNLNKMWQLSLQYNILIGPIPTGLFTSTKLTSVGLDQNALSGEVPSILSRMVQLEFINVRFNNLSGPIPRDLGRFMPNLTHIHGSSNSFNETLPNGLCDNGKLEVLAISWNKLEGAIPLSLARCASLKILSIQDNRLNSIPDYLGQNTSLEIVYAARNQFEGRLPRGLGGNSNLTYLDLSENRFTGEISLLDFPQLAQNLSVLLLAKNNLTGEIPAAMSMCKNLYHIDLGYNSLTGAVPLALANLSNLQLLYLEGNELNIFNPSIYMGFASKLTELVLAKNPWNTSIASEIGTLKVLRVLNLSYGGYTGLIPSSLGQLATLEVLDLSHNDLTGEVPTLLGELMVSLTSVNISFNRLTGPLPRAWVKFLIADPSSFQGNPGLCLEYNTKGVCSVVSRPSKSVEGKMKLPIWVTIGMVLGAVTTMLLVYVAFHFWRRRWNQRKRVDTKKEILEMNLTNEKWSLTFDDIMSASENLSDKFVIGRGAHGVVYKVKGVADKYPYIAVKKIVFTDHATTARAHKSFWAEVKSVGKARHRNLVSLLGFIKRDEIGLLLYEYVPSGNLYAALHGKKEGLYLTWDTRLQIAKGIAHGLAYLHHDCDAPVVHRDIKSCNVLLDNDLEPRISDFGLAKVLDMQQESKPWLSTQNVVGTFGYIPPEAGFSVQATPQVDVYSYGVLLLELLTGKEPTHDPSYGIALHIVAWVRGRVHLYGGQLCQSIIDPSLLYQVDEDKVGLASVEQMLRVEEIGLMCTEKNPSDRPTMRDVENMLQVLSKPSEKNNGDLDPVIGMAIAKGSKGGDQL